MEQVTYYDRQEQTTKIEQIYQHAALAFFYAAGKNPYGWLGRLCCKLYSTLPIFSHFYGWLQSLGFSKRKVVPFVEAFGLDPKEFIKDPKEFASFNDFFTRKLQPQARPIVSGAHVLAAPADGRYLCIQNLKQAETFFVKGQRFNLESFLGDQELAHRYSDGAMLLARLCPVDYHRFHLPCSCKIRLPEALPGALYSVNPIALRKYLSNLWMNKRWVIEMDTAAFGKILYCPIGATNVGSVSFTGPIGSQGEKGEELGFFSFGGSAIALFFQKDSVEFDQDLVEYGSQGVEVRLLMGQSIGQLRAS